MGGGDAVGGEVEIRAVPQLHVIELYLSCIRPSINQRRTRCPFPLHNSQNPGQKRLYDRSKRNERTKERRGQIDKQRRGDEGRSIPSE